MFRFNIFVPFFIIFFFSLTNAQTIEKTILIPQPKTGESRYFYVRFEVPRNTKSLSITYEYDKKQGANVLDLGLFNARFSGTDTDKNGFRGWSGGQRNAVFISEKSASNGYLAGKIPAGTWRVIFGLYKVLPEGVEVKVTIKINEIDTSALAKFAAETATTYDFSTFNFPKIQNPKSKIQNPKWFRGDLHTHTYYSDGIWTLPTLLKFAGDNGLDFVSVTEHNTSAHHAELDKLQKQFPQMLIMRGEEVTTYGGHFNVWNVPKGELIDFRVLPKDTNRLQSIVSDLQKRGMPASINHPTAFCGGCDWSYGEDWTKTMDSVEIWNGGWDVQDELSLQKWDALLQQNKRITAIGSSDSHTPPMLKSSYTTNLPIGLPTTHIGAKHLTANDLFDAIKRRRVFITEKPQMNLQVQSPKSKVQSPLSEIGDEIVLENLEQPRFRLLAENFPIGAKVLLIANGEKVREETIETANFDKEIELSLNRSGYVRIEIRDANNKMLALTNPIFIVREGEKIAEIQTVKTLNYAEIIANLDFIDRNILHIQD